MLKDNWLKLMSRLALDENLSTFDLLIESYSEKHRFYHNITHLKAVLTHLEKTRSLAYDQIAVEVALWFHDAIYQPFSSSNEKDSADWAAKFLKEYGLSEYFVDKVHKMIMATLHNSISLDRDDQLVVDIDLSILGSSEGEYLKFENNVRQEYRKVPTFIYKRKRKKILTSFLERKRIYFHDYFYEKYEAQARVNLNRTVKQL